MFDEFLVVGTFKEKRGSAAECITHLGVQGANGFRFKLSFADAYNLIDHGKYRFYVEIAGHKAYLAAVTLGGRMRILISSKVVKGIYLSNLPECEEDLKLMAGGELVATLPNNS